MVVLFCFFSGAVLADSESHKRAVEEFFEIWEMEKSLMQIRDKLLAFEIQMNPKMAPFIDVMKEFFEKYMSWDSLKDEMVNIYLQEFTEQEMNKINAFYRTPTGQKMIKRTPELMSRGGQIGMRRLQENRDELKRMIAARIQQPEKVFPRTKAALQIKYLDSALKFYKLDNGMYPTTEQGLEALVKKPQIGPIPKNWKESGYLKSSKVPKDPWGIPFVYVMPGQHGDFDLSSYGIDGEKGGEGENADINSWELE